MSWCEATREMIVGAGTVLDIETAQSCLDVGASFLTSTGLDLEIVNFARSKEVVVFPGALTPTEVITAWKAGSRFCEDLLLVLRLVDPVTSKALKAPFPKLRANRGLRGRHSRIPPEISFWLGLLPLESVRIWFNRKPFRIGSATGLANWHAASCAWSRKLASKRT